MCEYAAELLITADIDYEEVDIDDSEDLIKAYHIKIPVLSNGVQELNWPFTVTDAEKLFNGFEKESSDG